MSVEAQSQVEFGPLRVQPSADAVDAEALLVPVVGGREPGRSAPVRVELGDHAGGRQVLERGGAANLRGQDEPVGASVPADSEESLGLRVLPKPAEAALKQLGGDRSLAQLQPLVKGRESAHRAGGKPQPRRELVAAGLDVEAARAEHVVVADPGRAAQAGGVMDQVSHRARGLVSGTGVGPRPRPWRRRRGIEGRGRRSGSRSFHRVPPRGLADRRGVASSARGCLR